MLSDAPPALATSTRARAQVTPAARYTALLICGIGLPVGTAGFLVQLLAHGAPGLLPEWRLAPPDVAAVLAMGPAGLIVGAALGRSVSGHVDTLRALVWSGVAAGMLTAATALARTPVELGTLRLLSSAASGLSMVLAGRLVSASHFVQPVSVAGVFTALVAAGGVLAAWLAAGLADQSWRVLAAFGGAAGLGSPLALWLIAMATAGRLPVKTLPHDAGDDRRNRPGVTRATLGRLIGAPQGRATLSLFALTFFVAMAAGMLAFLLPLALGQLRSSHISGAGALRTMSLWAVAGAVLAAGVVRRMGARVTLGGLIALAILGTLLLTVPSPPVAVGAVALMACGAGIGGAAAVALTLAPDLGPDGGGESVARAAAAFAALGAVLAPYAGVHALTAGGLVGFFAACAGCLSLAGAAAAIQPAPR